MTQNFYKQFEDRFRGSRETIKERLCGYLPLLEPLKTLYPDPYAVDVGCGRGEWLELLGENGFRSHGIDQDPQMLKSALEMGLSAEEGDAIAYLKNLPESSVALISGFHIAEHLEFDDLLQLIRYAHRSLLPGGLLILETPNPENLAVGSNTFYTDPTHKRPLPPALLSFLPEYEGFERSVIFRLNGNDYGADARISVFDVITGASPDYAVVAQKKALPDVLALFDAELFKKRGFSMDELALRSAQRLEAQDATIAHLFDKIDDKEKMIHDLAGHLDAVNERFEAEIANLSQHFEAVAAELGAVYASRSWKITAPLRWGIGVLRSVKANVAAFKLRVKNRLKSQIGYILRRLIGWVRAHPRINALAARIASRFPSLAMKIKKKVYDADTAVYLPTFHHNTVLSPRAERIYQDLKRAEQKHSVKGEH